MRIEAFIQVLGDEAVCLIDDTGDGVNVRYSSATQKVLSTLRAGIKSDEMFRAACCDVVDECV